MWKYQTHIKLYERNDHTLSNTSVSSYSILIPRHFAIANSQQIVVLYIWEGAVMPLLLRLYGAEWCVAKYHESARDTLYYYPCQPQSRAPSPVVNMRGDLIPVAFPFPKVRIMSASSAYHLTHTITYNLSLRHHVKSSSSRLFAA